MRRLATVAALIACVVVTALAVGGPEDRGPSTGEAEPATLVKGATTGSSRAGIELKTGREAKTILAADNMRPGDWVKGWVLVRNATDRPALDLSLTRRVRTTRGPFGGALNRQLRLRIVSVKRGVRHRVPFERKLKYLADGLELGELEAQRLFRFKVNWPDGGAGPAGKDDNRFQASATDVRFIWHLTER